jgi:hypothetical protein
LRRTIVLTVTLAIVLPLGPPALAQPPANDAFADAVALPGSTGDVAGTTVEATAEAGEPLHGVDAAGTSVWYRWTAPAEGTLLLTLVGNELRSYVAAYTGSEIDGLTLVARESTTSPFRLWFRVTPSTEYVIAVDSFDMGNAPPSTGPFTLAWTFYEPPPNDDFADAEPINGTTGGFTSTNGGATSEAGEPQHGRVGGASLWYSWSPPSSGAFRFDVSSSEFPPLIGIYTGSGVDALIEVASIAGQQPQMHHTVELEAEATTVYMIALDGWFESIGDFDLSWRPLGPPNDDLIDATVLNGPTHSVSLDSTLAAKEAGEPNHAGNPGGASAWYEWTTPWWHGTATITAEADGFEPILALYLGFHLTDMEDLVPYQSDVGSQGIASITVPIDNDAPGQFMIAVDGENTGDGPGRGQIDVSIEFHPSNDDFVDAENFQCCGFGGGWAGSTSGATAEPGEPDHAGTAADDSIWFSFNPGLSGTLELTTSREYPPARLAVYTGSALPDLVPIVSRTPDANQESRVRFEVSSGTTYHLAIDSAAGETGTVPFGINMVVDPPEAALAPAPQLGATSVGLRVGWDGPQGEDAYFELEKKVGSSPWAPVDSTTETTATVAATPGIAHHFRVKSITPSSSSDWEVSDPITSRVIQDRHVAIRYRGTWTRRDVASASGGTIHTSVDRGATARLAATGRTFALVAPKGPRFGKAALFVDGVFMRNVNFYADGSEPRTIVFRRNWANPGTHSLLLKVLARRDARSLGNRVPLDAFLVVSS